MNFIKKQSVFGWITFAAAVLSLVGLIIFIVSGTTGFMAGQPISALTIVFTIIAILGLGTLFAISEKIDKRIVGGILFVLVVLLAVAMCMFIMDRLQLFADVYFIPVNHPKIEDAALSATIAGIVFYILAIIGTIVVGFSGKLNKENA